MGSSESTLIKMPHCWKSHIWIHLTDWSYNQRETTIQTRYMPYETNAYAASNGRFSWLIRINYFFLILYTLTPACIIDNTIYLSILFHCLVYKCLKHMHNNNM